MKLISPAYPWLAGALATLLASTFAPAARAQIHPSAITAAQATALPYRESGKLLVSFGSKFYFGTATYIHRYTGLTAGHLLYDPQAGFAATTSFMPGYYNESLGSQQIGYFAVLSGYQEAAGVDPDSSAAFARDMGYFLLLSPAVNDEWAAFSADPTLLTTGTDFLALGYAGADGFSGDVLTYVHTTSPYFVDLPGLYQNNSYYTVEGMSGGPVYLTQADGSMVITAVNVAGTDPPDAAESGARAITEDVRPLLLDAEYTHGAIIGGVIKGPLTVAAGATAKYRTGLTYKSGATEGDGLPRRYEEIELLPKGPVKKLLTVTKFSPEKFMITFPASLPSGTQVVLRMLRDTEKPKAQTTLQTYTVTVQ